MENEIKIKWSRILELMEREKIKGVLINKVSNFAWFTGGKINYVGLHTEIGVCKLLITKEKIYYITNNIEHPRINEEELGDYGFEPIVENWFGENFDEKIKKIISGKIGSDVFIPDYVQINLEKLHYPLLPEELERYKKLGRDASEVVTEVCKEIKQGEKEIEIAGKLSEKLWYKNIVPIVILIAGDERIERFRHPIPTENKIRKHVMIVLCGRRKGLIVSLTRFVYFGDLPNELRKRHLSVCKIDAIFINSTRRGKTIGEVFKEGIKAYEKEGFGNEWEKHHQGGPTGYLTRYFRATEKSEFLVKENQAYAWNPSITGTKSEDTIITTEEKPLIITEDKNWPLLKIEVNGEEILRPDIQIK
ncbi:MAG: aminopeptidase P family N-terminal domain-containing protein [Candidatus Omnitrophica bacterium]|nr:aminopeptidase P family N-terminal domain-containing protein [Candidatus Omnitrophota bacterium]